MINKRSKHQRIDIGFEDQLKKSMKVRVNNGLADPFDREDVSIREGTNLLTKTVNFRKALRELETKPKGKKR